MTPNPDPQPNGRDIPEEDIERARRMAPRMDRASLGILAGSAVFAMMQGSQPEYPTTDRNGNHHDVTGFFQRNRGRK